MARKLRVWVDHNVCVGNAMCTTIAPKVFALNDQRQSEAVNPEGDTVEEILDAAQNCPVGAIIVEDTETGERLFPEPVLGHGYTPVGCSPAQGPSDGAGQPLHTTGDVPRHRVAD